ncbi:glycosyltransferase family 4 protein [Methylobacterium nodulans]|nr:glycosyltransferase family 4 protein [Methylobacterium nodulans]
MNVTELSRVSVERTYSAVTAAAMSILRTRLDSAEHDAVLVCCDGLGPLLTFANRRKPVVNLCFTPLRATYDDAYRDRLLAHGGPARPVKRAAETAFRLVDRMAWRNFDAVICIAETVRRRVADNRLFPESKIHLAYPGVEPGHAAPGDLSEPMFLLPGRIMWTKNIELAISGFRLFLKHAPPALQRFRLHIAGMVDAKSRPYLARLQHLAGGEERISFETMVSDDRMRALYAQAWAVLAPAFNEDFGLTPIEAMAHGRPVLACNRGGLRETVLDGVTGLLVEPEPAAFAAGLRRIAQDEVLARQLGAQGPARAATFTWPRFVETIDSVLDGVQHVQRISA